MRNIPVMLALVALLAGCVTPPDLAEPGNLPEDVAALAAPGQDLSSARVLPADNCFWYQHSGPVEVTLLPLRSRDGSPICLAPA